MRDALHTVEDIEKLLLQLDSANIELPKNVRLILYLNKKNYMKVVPIEYKDIEDLQFSANSINNITIKQLN